MPNIRKFSITTGHSKAANCQELPKNGCKVSNGRGSSDGQKARSKEQSCFEHPTPRRILSQQSWGNMKTLIKEEGLKLLSHISCSLLALHILSQSIYPKMKDIKWKIIIPVLLKRTLRSELVKG